MAALYPPPSRYKDPRSVTMLYLCYLNEVQSANKLEYRHDLESTIISHLCNGPQHVEYTYHQTRNILFDSLQSDNVIMSKVIDAWFGISNYASNLYAQPWRKEYHEIRLYSGYYKHKIEPYLKGAEELLQEMGYCRLNEIMVLKSSINNTKLCGISLDAFIAMCECKILLDLYHHISKLNSCYTYRHVFDIRHKHGHSVNETLKFFQDHSRKPHYSTSYHHSPHVNTYHMSTFEENQRNGYPMARHRGIPSSSYNSDYFRQDRVDATSVPTGKLIEIEDNGEGDCSQNRSQVADWVSESHFSGEDYSSDQSRKTCAYSDDDELDKNYFYSKALPKDYGSRPLNKNFVSSPRATKNNDDRISNSFNNLFMNDYNQSDGKKKSSNTPKLNKMNSSHSKKDSSPFISSSCVSISSSRSSRDSKSSEWHCPHCTFINKDSAVCKMCNRSKMASKDEPLESGGKECNNCTLINGSRAKECEACGGSLRNASTYI